MPRQNHKRDDGPKDRASGKPHTRASTICGAKPGERDHAGCGELTAPLLWPTGTGNCVPPLTNGLLSRRREQPGELDCVDHTIPGKCEPSVDVHSTKLPHPPQHCGPSVPLEHGRHQRGVQRQLGAPEQRQPIAHPRETRPGDPGRPPKEGGGGELKMKVKGGGGVRRGGWIEV